LDVTTKILNALVYNYAFDKFISLDDFITCIVRATSLIDYYSDDEIKDLDNWEIKNFLWKI
jgi:hypothetical protein